MNFIYLTEVLGFSLLVRSLLQILASDPTTNSGLWELDTPTRTPPCKYLVLKRSVLFWKLFLDLCVLRAGGMAEDYLSVREPEDDRNASLSMVTII